MGKGLRNMRMGNMEKGNTVTGEGNVRKGNVVMWARGHGKGGGEHGDEEHEDGKQT
jgi:hypothetical protein